MKQNKDNRNPMDKEEVWNKLETLGVKELKDKDFNALNNKQTTDMMKLSVSDSPEMRKVLEREKVEYSAKEGQLNFNGKLQIVDSPGEGAKIHLIPQRNEIKNDLGFSQQELDKLQKGELLHKKDVKGDERLYQLDKDTNNVLSVKSKDIKLPETIAGERLTEEQKENIRKGEVISLIVKAKVIRAGLDLTERGGLRVVDELGNRIERVQGREQTESEKKQQEKKPEIKFTDDEQRLKHIANNGLVGIKDIYPNNAPMRSQFFEKYNMANDVKQAHKIEKASGDLSPAEQNTQGKKMNADLNEISNALKSKASSALDSFSIGKERKQEENTGVKIGFGR